MYIADVFSRGGRDLFADLEHLLDAVDRSHSTAIPSTTGLDVWANDDALQVTLDAPGLDPTSIDLSVLGDSLTVRANLAAPTDQRTWLRRERPTGAIARTVRLPYAVDNNQAKAQYRDGVLTVSLIRQAGSKPQRIVVQAA